MGQVLLENLVQEFKLEILQEQKEPDIEIKVADLNRPGLVLAGYTQYFDRERVQIIGKTEMEFLLTLGEDVAQERWTTLCRLQFPCLIITRGLDIPKAWLSVAAEYKKPILRTYVPTSRFLAKLADYIEQQVAPSTTIHAVLVDVHGVGTLIMGESGIGKSETALELIKRGHRLVADDAVEVIRSGEDELIGSAPEILRHIIEVRGLGILDVTTLFGIGAVRMRQKINQVIKLEEWHSGAYYDRLGIDVEQQEILGVKLPCKTIPVRPGRNIASIVEVAAMNYRLNILGYDAATAFIEKQKNFCSTD